MEGISTSRDRDANNEILLHIIVPIKIILFRVRDIIPSAFPCRLVRNAARLRTQDEQVARAFSLWGILSFAGLLLLDEIDCLGGESFRQNAIAFNCHVPAINFVYTPRIDASIEIVGIDPRTPTMKAGPLSCMRPRTGMWKS